MASRSDPLHAAAAAYRAGELGRAAKLLGKVLDKQADNADALFLRGLVAHRRGRIPEAVGWLDRAVAADPEHTTAWTNRGRVLRAAGQHLEALSSLNRALALRDDLPEAHLERALALLDLGEAAAAEGAAQSALRLRPEWTAAWEVLGRSLLEADRNREAEAVFRRLLSLDPTVASAHANLGIALRDQGRLAEAEAALGRAVALAPDFAPAHAAMGGVREARGSDPGAEAAWRMALQRDPNDAVTLHCLGALLCRRDRVDEGLELHRRAVQLAPDKQPLWIGFADAVGRAERVPDDLGDDLLRCYAVDDVDHQLLERATRQLLRGSLQGGTLAREPLLIPLLRRTIVCHPTWEAALRGLRGALLQRAADGQDVAPTLAEALAVQAAHTEYVWAVSDAERALLAALPNNHPIHRLYAPPEPVVDGEALDVIGLTDDPVSVAVRDQYETSPYPQLVGLHRKPAAPLHQVVHSLFPHFEQAPRPDADLEVLVAGCGTGQQALAAATRYARARVLAVDLSAASLRYARRRASELQISNLRFAQADILALGALPHRFHLVEAGGVLHHMADPAAGWRVLVDRTLPGGLMKIGLYSERGRAAVVAAHALSEERGWEPTPAGIRRARGEIIALPADHPAHSLVWSPDFYSVSGFRDLVLHVCEHRFRLPQIARLLGELGLVFVGFQHFHPEIARRYDARFPDDPARTDLASWDALEADHPEIFAGMYQFWCWRPLAG